MRQGADIDNPVGDDQGTFGAAIGLVFDAQAFLGGPRLQRSAIVIDNGKVVSVAVENSPPEGECPFPRLPNVLLTSSHRLARRPGHQHCLDWHLAKWTRCDCLLKKRKKNACRESCLPDAVEPVAVPRCW